MAGIVERCRNHGSVASAQCRDVQARLRRDDFIARYGFGRVRRNNNNITCNTVICGLGIRSFLYRACQDIHRHDQGEMGVLTATLVVLRTVRESIYCTPKNGTIMASRSPCQPRRLEHSPSSVSLFVLVLPPYSTPKARKQPLDHTRHLRLLAPGHNPRTGLSLPTSNPLGLSECSDEL
ncbi:uncharacterized protein EI97DRAFT_4026 [Westerdykella ornata]|uniref:Uncharacterized protein n=1 Tax=Westerdykella ornata TaxID=318751 RepID=A0A6A6JX47_WESOR|nr:uncharacterized protein EI97DRAFT_4026 [Westerdykella ornata]KAF2280643.1 hypothetical protein EI97DRAFT_4026 [Westerdykella ornata]